MGSAQEIKTLFGDHPIAVAVIAYWLVCIPVAFWLQGPMGFAGTVDWSVVIGGLLMGTMLFPPMIAAKLKRTYGGGQTERLGFEQGEQRDHV